MKQIDAMGLACPGPVLKTKDALAGLRSGEKLSVFVDNDAARDNVIRFVQSCGNAAKVISQTEGSIEIEVTRGSDPVETRRTPDAGAAPVIFVGSDVMGRGDDKLGAILVGAMLGALGETKPRPSALVLMNAGVKLATEGSEALAKLEKLEELGIEILVCGTCLDYFQLKDRLATGKVSNMFTILETFLKAGNVVAV